MKFITPIGVIAKNPLKSREFYRKVLKMDRVQTIEEYDSDDLSGHLLRLESSEIQVDSTVIASFDRKNSPFRANNSKILLYVNDLEALQLRLESYEIIIEETENGRKAFVDFNGITWNILEKQSLSNVA